MDQQGCVARPCSETRHSRLLGYHAFWAPPPEVRYDGIGLWEAVRPTSGWRCDGACWIGGSIMQTANLVERDRYLLRAVHVESEDAGSRVLPAHIEFASGRCSVAASAS